MPQGGAKVPGPIRVTTVIARVDKKVHSGSSAGVGIAVPTNGGLFVHKTELEIMDNTSNGWQYARPNITKTFNSRLEDKASLVYYWQVENRDESLERVLKCTFSWMGPAPHIVEGQINNAHGGLASYFDLGVELPSEIKVTGYRFYACENDGRYEWSEAVPDYLSFRWIAEGLPGGSTWPGDPNHNVWRVRGFNRHSTASRLLRISLDTED